MHHSSEYPYYGLRYRKDGGAVIIKGDVMCAVDKLKVVVWVLAAVALVKFLGIVPMVMALLMPVGQG